MAAPESPDATGVLDVVRAGGLLASGEPVVVLLSGGRDSVCLLDVAVTIAGANDVTALHVNYGLREGAAGDERHCEALCTTLGVSFVAHRASAAPDTGNLQAWARDVRYAAAVRAAEARDATVAAGHTSSDQAETILYRLASSPSRRALLGMPARDGRLIRPLLEVSREQTAAYCRARGLAWREDETNDSDAYARNRVRAGLLAALREIHPAAERNVVRAAEILRAEGAVLDEAVSGLVDGAQAVPLEALRAAPPALARLAVVRLAERALGRLLPAVGARAGEILALAEGAALDVGDHARARVEHGMLRFEATPPLPGAPPPPTRS
jgi:tRNA(Ile)-lysidine synthase